MAEMSNDNNSNWVRSLPGEMSGKWPREGESFEEAAFLRHCTSVDMEDELLVNMLDAYGIPCVRHYPADGGFGKVIMGISGMGADLYVPKSMLEDALSLCEGVPEDENI
jgi:hypothetical protein